MQMWTIKQWRQAGEQQPNCSQHIMTTQATSSLDTRGTNLWHSQNNIWMNKYLQSCRKIVYFT